MSILVDRNTRLLVQGITGREGSFHTRQMIDYGTRVVAGVRAGKGGTEVDGVPVFNTVKQAVRATGANASVIFVPKQGAPDAILEATDAGLGVVVCITDWIPTQDMIRVVDYVQRRGCADAPPTVLIGPNCPGLITAGECKIGIMPGNVVTKGPVGMISRSGTLTYEIVYSLSQIGLGQTTCVGIGGDPVLGTRFIDLLPRFEADPETKVVVLVGEIGGTDEEDAAGFIRTMTKPVVGFISGRTAPPGKRMGHAGAIVSGGKGTAQAKVEALTAAGVPVAESTREIPALVQAALAGKR
jgi:succinyl-CoA synthetase alpha subunit